MEEIVQGKIKELFTACARANVKFSADDQRVLHEIYQKAEKEDKVLSFFPLSPYTLLGGRAKSKQDLDAQLHAEASAIYPGIGEKGIGLNEYFQITYARPAVIRSDDPDRALFIFPVDRDAGTYTVNVFSLKQVQQVLEVMAKQNEGQLMAFRDDVKGDMNGMTEKLVHAKRVAVEESIRVFERETGLRVQDNLRDAFRMAAVEEVRYHAANVHEETIASLIFAEIDRDERFLKQGRDGASVTKNDAGKIAGDVAAALRKNPVSFN